MKGFQLGKDENAGGKAGPYQFLILLFSILLLILAVYLWRGLEARNPNAPIVDMLRSRGYTVELDQLYYVGSFPDQSISQVLSGVDLSEAVAASEAAGFPSRVDQAGEVSLLVCMLGNGDAITVYLLDGEMELCFLQSLVDGSVTPLDEVQA